MFTILKRVYPLFILLALHSGFLQILAQTNPMNSACGLPAEGDIVAAGAFTLTDDCTLTGTLTISNTVTINGATHTIKASDANEALFEIGSASGNSLTLNSLTIDASSAVEQGERPDAVIVNGTLNAINVTFRGNPNGSAINVGSNATATLTNVLLEDHFASRRGTEEKGVALHINANATVSLNGAVIRNNRYGGGAVVVKTNASLTAGGCLTLSGNIPYNVVGEWTDNSTDVCSGAIGNGGNAVIAAPTEMTCGLPNPGNLNASAIYTMTSDCNLSPSSGDPSNAWQLSEDVEITIDGAGHRLIGGSIGSPPTFDDATPLIIRIAGSATLKLINIVLESVSPEVFGSLSAIHIDHKNTGNSGIFVFGNADFTCSSFQDNRKKHQVAFGSAVSSHSGFADGATNFKNTVILNNTGGTAAAVSLSNAPITFEGCLSFSRNIPRLYSGSVIDNSTGACAFMVGPSESETFACSEALTPTPTFTPKNTFTPTPTVTPTGSQAATERATQRATRLPFPTPRPIQSPAATPTHAFKSPTPSPTPTTIATATVPSFIVLKDGTILHTVQPGESLSQIAWHYRVNPMHIIRLNGLEDSFNSIAPGMQLIIRSEDTHSADSNPAVETLPVRADGFIYHIVKYGDTIGAIAEAYGVYWLDIIRRNRLTDSGHWIYPGQILIIRDAS